MSADYVISPPPQPTIAVAGTSKVFPVRRIWCVGRNYIEHIREMGQDERAPPFFFAKPADAIVADGGTVPYPSLTKDMHHEVELVVALKSGGRNIPVGKANECIYGYAVGIDLTRRDLQFASREIKRPWEVGKAFDHSAPCGPLKPASESGHPSKGKITLKVNGKVRQDGDLNQMIWNVPETISKLSEMVALEAGDIIMTGTPSGVAATVAAARQRDAAVRQHIGAARELERDRHVLLHQHAGEALAIEVAYASEHALHDGGRETQRRLVEHHQIRRAHQAASDSEHLLLAAGQRAGELMAALGQGRKQRVDVIEVALARGARARQHGAHGQIFGDRQRRENLAAFGDLADAEIADLVARPAGNIQAAEIYAPARRPVHAGDGADQRGLAGAVGTDNGDNRALLDLEANAVERLGVAVKHVEVLDFKHHAIASTPR